MAILAKKRQDSAYKSVAEGSSVAQSVCPRLHHISVATISQHEFTNVPAHGYINAAPPCYAWNPVSLILLLQGSATPSNPVLELMLGEITSICANKFLKQTQLGGNPRGLVAHHSPAFYCLQAPTATLSPVRLRKAMTRHRTHSAQDKTNSQCLGPEGAWPSSPRARSLLASTC